MDIKLIPTAELLTDRTETIEDIALNKMALKAGVEHYGENKSVKRRLMTNEAILELIKAELARRKNDN